MKDDTQYFRIDGKILRLSHLDKIMYPESGFTKKQVIEYYRKVAPVLLPHLRDRPITLKRYPEGVTEPFFYAKRCPPYRPRWLPTIALNAVDYCATLDVPGLIWLVNLGTLEFHVPLARGPHLERPDAVVFDLDPGPPAGLVECARVALWVRDILLQEAGLKSFPKTSGGKGLQVYVPLNPPPRSNLSYAQTKTFARHLAERLEREHPEAVVSVMKKQLRAGKILIDWSQNDPNKTTVAVYSLRAGTLPFVSTPLHWKEVERLVRMEKTENARFIAKEALERFRKEGDLFLPLLKLQQELPPALAAGRRAA